LPEGFCFVPRAPFSMIAPGPGEGLGLLATATVGEGGWVDLPEPIIVRAGEAVVAVPKPAQDWERQAALGPWGPPFRSAGAFGGSLRRRTSRRTCYFPLLRYGCVCAATLL